jgi:phage terminase large subunit
VYWYNGGYMLDEKLYQTELLNEHLAATLKGLPKAPVVADSAEPKSIAELQTYGLNVVPCEKGQESVRLGIKQVQGRCRLDLLAARPRTKINASTVAIEMLAESLRATNPGTLHMVSDI